MSSAREPTAATPSLRSISVIVTAMNEEANLRPTVEAIVRSVAPRFPVYEVLIIEDGSQDGTREVAAALAAENPRIRVYHNQVNRGLAYGYRRGLGLATHRYTAWVAGNNLVPPEAFAAIFDQVGDADMVVTYLLSDGRGRARRILSRAFTVAMNVLFGTRLRYFTGPCVYNTAAAKQVHVISHGSMFVVEILLRLIKAGQSYVQVGIRPLPRSGGASKTFRPRNVVGVAVSILHLIWDMGLRPRSAAPPSVPFSRDDKFSAMINTGR
jgi:glycosyltransferase involved in cell wall biosynthesis